MVTTSHMWLFKFKCQLIIIKQDKKNPILWLHQPHFKCLIVTYSYWLHTGHFSHRTFPSLLKVLRALFCRLEWYPHLERRMYNQQLKDFSLFIVASLSPDLSNRSWRGWVEEQYLIKLPHKKTVKINIHSLKSNCQEKCKELHNFS